jgi:hypothetical protein
MKQPKNLFGLENCCLLLELAKTSQPCCTVIIKTQSDSSKIPNTGINEPSTLTQNTLSFVRSGRQSKLKHHMCMTKLVICWLNHCPKISMKGYEAMWGWLLQTFLYLHEWVREMSSMPIKQMIHMCMRGSIEYTKKFVRLRIILLPWEKRKLIAYVTILFSCFMFLYLSSFLTMFKINLIVVTCRCKKLQTCNSNVV